jgi:hypothetical protein
LVRLGAWMPFEPAAEMLAHFTKVGVGRETARRATEGAGAAYVAVQGAELARLERENPMPPAGPALMQLSVDGAMVPLVKGEWAEVKTLAVGVVHQRERDGEMVPHTEEISYFSRLADHMTFARSAFVETYRRGTAMAGKVAGVADGSDWAQTFFDLHRPDAVRILDWPHGAEHLAQAASAVFGTGSAQSAQWLHVQLRELKEGDPEVVLAKLRGIRDDLLVAGGRAEAAQVVGSTLDYLEKRRAMIRYAEFASAGYPIGSGIVESANKLVVEARLKGSGMHWERGNVDPMLALRNVACNDRWGEVWPQIASWLRQEPKRRSAARRAARQAARVSAQQSAQPATAEPRDIQGSAPDPLRKTRRAKPKDQPAAGPSRPAPDHPWRRMPVGRARQSP